MTSTLVLLALLFFCSYMVVWYEIHQQRKFEQHCLDKWNGMTEEEKKASGMENMYC